MIGEPSIAVASTATRWYGGEAKILRDVLFHAIAPAGPMGMLAMLRAHVPPFTALVPPHTPLVDMTR